MNQASDASGKALVIRSIEGTPTKGDFLIKPLLKGDHMSLMEVRLQPGVASAPHVHAHESLIYVVKGKLRTTVESNVTVLGPGDVGRHPAHVAHSVEALEETIFIEIKSPTPDIGSVLAARAP
ncbi:MAG: cupin domain-containing protein [Rubrivivax sp.]|nr:cupin domain-containing protein [Rubrivivax sp.]